MNQEKIKAAQPGETIRDNKVVGLRLRARKSVKVWEVRYRDAYGAERSYRVGPWPLISLQEARRIASDVLVRVAHGGDPAAERKRLRASSTVGELLLDTLEGYWSSHARRSTYDEIDRLVTRVLMPDLGGVRLPQLTPDRVERWHQGTGRTRPGVANRALATLSKACSLAERDGLIPRNPCRGIQRFAERKVERYLSAEEYDRLNLALDEWAPRRPVAVAVIRLLALTGWRRSEACRLRWDDIDQKNSRCYLRETKTTARHAVVSQHALRLLLRQPRRGVWVFPGRAGATSPASVSTAWKLVRASAGLGDVRLHDLRHSFASLLASKGESLVVIGALLGHKSTQTTARYAHLAQAEQLRAATSATDSISHLED